MEKKYLFLMIYELNYFKLDVMPSFWLLYEINGFGYTNIKCQALSLPTS